MNPTKQLLLRLQAERHLRHLPRLQELVQLDWHAEVLASHQMAWCYPHRMMKNTPLPAGGQVICIKITCWGNLAVHLNRVRRKTQNQLYATDTIGIGVAFHDRFWGGRVWTLVLLKKPN